MLQPTTLKFLSYVAENGYLHVAPAIACVSAGSGRLAMAATGHSDLSAIAPKTPVAVHALSMKTESVLVRGRFPDLRGIGPIKVWSTEIDWAYDSMPPSHGQAYPMPPIEAVTSDLEVELLQPWRFPAR